MIIEITYASPLWVNWLRLLWVCVLLFLVACDVSEGVIGTHYLKYFGKDGEHWGNKFILNDDGSIYILGTAQQGLEKKHLYLAYANEAGEIIWEDGNYTPDPNDSTNIDVEARDMIITADGKLVILSSVGEGIAMDFQVTLFDPRKQETIMNKKFGSTSGDLPHSITEIPGSDKLPAGYIICGRTETAGNFINESDAFQLYINQALDSNKLFTSSFNQGVSDMAVKAVQYDDARILVFGYTNSIHDIDVDKGTHNYWMYLLNEQGVPDKNVQFGLFEGNEKTEDISDEYAMSVISTTTEVGDGFLVSGVSKVRNGVVYPYFLKLYKDLSFSESDISFQSALGEDNLSLIDAQIEDPTISSVWTCVSKGGHYYVIANQANISSDILLIKMSSAGKKIWSRSIGGSGFDGACDIQETVEGDILILGTMTVGGNTQKIALMRLNRNGRFE